MLSNFHSAMVARRYAGSFVDRGDIWPNAETLQQASPDRIALGGGLLADTLVATQNGWRPVGTIAAGDLVLTFDTGLQPVVELRHQTLQSATDRLGDAHRPLLVPAGAIGNRQPLRLLPDQDVLMESDVADQILGDPFVLMRASSLAGYRGIASVAPEARETVVIPVFAQEQIVHANGAALLHCPSRSSLGMRPESESMAPPAPSRYPRLSPRREAQLALWIQRAETCNQTPAQVSVARQAAEARLLS